MAGAGYKLFNTGDVLTAAQVNTYLMEQTIMVFANATARDTALSGVLAQGMQCFLKDTNTMQYYSGSAWTTLSTGGDITSVNAGTGISGGGTSGDVTITNSMATTIDAKGDLIAGTANDTFARLAVGNNGETLVAISANSTGLGWQASYAAGKNKIINGNMQIDQRNNGSAATVSGNDVYTLDRFKGWANGGGVFSVQRSTTAPAGFSYSALLTVTTADTSIAAGDNYRWAQAIEGFNVADLNFGTADAQTVTVSFWVRSNLTGTYGGAIYSPNASRSYVYSYSISAANTWEKKSVTLTGDTSGTWLKDNGIGMVVYFDLGSGSNYQNATGSWVNGEKFSTSGNAAWIGTLSNNLYITGVQLERGSVATGFSTAVGTLAGELAACQRYYQALSKFGCAGYASGNGESIMNTLPFVTAMRATPTVTITSNGSTSRLTSASIQDTSSTSAILQVVANGAGFAGIYGATTATASIEL